MIICILNPPKLMIINRHLMKYFKSIKKTKGNLKEIELIIIYYIIYLI